MADAWVELDAVDLSEIESTAETLTEVLDSVASFFNATAAVLDSISALLGASSNPLIALINAAIDAVEATILDMLQNNIALAVHVNINWDKDWVYRDTTGKVSDFVEDGQLPWSGNGMQGWLAELSISTRDETDPFRPLSDDETEVSGFIIANGITSADELEDLKDLFDAFVDTGDFASLLESTSSSLENLEAAHEALTRLGPAVYDEFLLSVVKNPDDEVDAVLEALGITDTLSASDFAPVPGNYPKWVSVPMASIVPPLKELMDTLRRIIDNLRMATDSGDLLAKLADALAKRAELLAEAAEALQGIIETLVSILDALTGTNFIWLDAEDGGTDNFFSRALSADDLPDFGSRGIVAGIVGISTSDDVTNHLEAFWELLGYKREDFTSDITTREQQIEDAYDDIF